jgi:hypothetical protein
VKVVATDFFTARGISGGVKAGRRYREYTAPDDVIAAAPELARHPLYLRRYATGRGWLIPKYPPFDDLPPIRPQLRPIVAPAEPWTHVHREMPGHELKPHLESKKWRKDHEGIGPDDEHTHLKRSRYLLGPEAYEREQGRRVPVIRDAERLDVHPQTDLSKPGRVFFVIEGTPKNDSLVSRGEKALNVPAVAQWHAPELPRFAREYLRDELVFVVCDSDWNENSEVIFHAIVCREFLRRVCGVEAYVAAPPPRERSDDEGSFKNGVDDFLADANRSPDELVIPSREIDHEAFARWKASYEAGWDETFEDPVPGKRGPYKKTLDLDIAVAKLLVLASQNGRTIRGLNPLCRALGKPMFSTPYGGSVYQSKSTSTVWRSLERLREAEAFRPTGRYVDWMEGEIYHTRRGQRRMTEAGPRAHPGDRASSKPASPRCAPDDGRGGLPGALTHRRAPRQGAWSRPSAARDIAVADGEARRGLSVSG